MSKEDLELLRGQAVFDSSHPPEMEHINAMKELLDNAEADDVKLVRKLINDRFQYIENRMGQEFVSAGDGYLYAMCYQYESLLGENLSKRAIGACWCTLINFIKMNGYNHLKLSKQDVEDAEGDLAEIISKKLRYFDPTQTKVSAYFHNDMTHILLQTKGSNEKKYHNDLMGRIDKALASFTAEGIVNPSVSMIKIRINSQGYKREVNEKQIMNCLKRRHETVSMSDLTGDIPADMMTPEEALLKNEEALEIRNILDGLPDTQFKPIILGYLRDVDPSRIIVGDIYEYAQKVHHYTGSKNSFEHEYRLFKHSLIRKYGKNPNQKVNPKRSSYNSSGLPSNLINRAAEQRQDEQIVEDNLDVFTDMQDIDLIATRDMNEFLASRVVAEPRGDETTVKS